MSQLVYMVFDKRQGTTPMVYSSIIEAKTVVDFYVKLVSRDVADFSIYQMVLHGDDYCSPREKW